LTSAQFDGAWLDGEGRLTPKELQTATFPLCRLGRRGYEEEPVRRFLRVVHAEFVRVLNERDSLWHEVQRLRRRILAGEDGGDPQVMLYDEADVPTAPPAAYGYVADAQADRSRATREAKRRRDHILQEAQQHSDEILNDAHTRAREAAVFALSHPAPPQSDQEWQAAQAELAYLRTYSDVYRAHLRAYTEYVLRGIEEWESEETSFEEAANAHTDQWSIGP
jgi:cell division septum initiation protein DivIVA